MKRRDITLGEMQDECRKQESCAPCEHKDFCKNMLAPKHWNLTDPPRFTEAQMAFFRAWHAIGAKTVNGGTDSLNNPVLIFTGSDGTSKGFMGNYPKLTDIGYMETLDLAELLGKDVDK